MFTLCQIGSIIFLIKSINNDFGGFMTRPVVTERYLARKEEIINACLELYKDFSFKDISIKDIADYTSFSRPSIYNYFETKEEIFLAIYQKEYENWKEDLDKIAASKRTISVKQFADKLAKTLNKRFFLLKLLSMNQYDMEEYSRLDRLIEFKKAYGASMTALEKALKRAFKGITKTKCENFIYSFMPFMIGIYPYVYVNKKQADAMKKAGLKFKKQTVYEITYNMIIKLLEKA